MRRKSVSPQTTELEWLQASYDKKKNRSLELGVKAIDTLIKEGKTVSYRTVSDKSKVIDPEGIGIHQNTIRKNQELHNHFLQYRTTKVYNPRKRSSKPLDNDLDAFRHIKQDRDIDRVRQRYMQLTKPELVDLLIRMEQYIAYQNQHWLKSEFEKFINE
ncbi:hypothetical protein [Paenibacillus dendritiformis]|uniref:Uncharacterized protein n=1 Tax=Paenibacillus dendritiformis C454 TaxID=1131935 RepID=H3SIP3_9BACL|nr:hypothetical protein [Paenibacillus dendritiformis]EHQ60997.1 hypothetical protein PDENDC454_17083 [Paenibacillus dendritiformis C454]CAH8770875.1 hypothetical protein H7S4_003610 [Paenibacillus dendritiformis]